MVTLHELNHLVTLINLETPTDQTAYWSLSSSVIGEHNYSTIRDDILHEIDVQKKKKGIGTDPRGAPVLIFTFPVVFEAVVAGCRRSLIRFFKMTRVTTPNLFFL